MERKTFASDNYSGVHAEVMQALIDANTGHASSYGADPFTAEATELFQKLFGKQTEVFFVYNGTGANVLGLKAITESFHSVICSELAHINVDESTAPERFTGCKLLPVPHIHGKITAEAVEASIQRVGDQHHPQARVVSISQTTEYATVYSIEEIKKLSATARKHGLFLHMDGARISNAAVSLEADFRDFTSDAGVDILSFGGTKNGMMFGEAILVLNPEAARYLQYFRKQGMQLHSKMRFISSQFTALIRGDLWKRNAAQSNEMAKRLETGLRRLGVQITHPVDANGVFALLPADITEELQKAYYFYVWNEKTGEVRLMCSFDTTAEEVDGFIGQLSRLITH